MTTRRVTPVAVSLAAGSNSGTRTTRGAQANARRREGDVQDASSSFACAQTRRRRFGYLLVHAELKDVWSCEQHASSSRCLLSHFPRNPCVDHSAQAQGVVAQRYAYTQHGTSLCTALLLIVFANAIDRRHRNKSFHH